MADTATPQASEWTSLLDKMTAEHAGHHVTIELLDPTYGDQHEAERLPFAYATYDPRDDVVIVAVGGNSPRFPVVLRHMVWHPTQVDAVDDGGLAAIRAVEPDGTTTVVTFYDDAIQS